MCHIEDWLISTLFGIQVIFLLCTGNLISGKASVPPPPPPPPFPHEDDGPADRADHHGEGEDDGEAHRRHKRRRHESGEAEQHQEPSQGEGRSGRPESAAGERGKAAGMALQEDRLVGMDCEMCITAQVGAGGG